jgi:hypothetical protein
VRRIVRSTGRGPSPLYPAKPPSSRKACSAAVVVRPRARFRCGKRPKRAMMSRWAMAHFRLSASPVSFSRPSNRVDAGLLVGQQLGMLVGQIEERPQLGRDGLVVAGRHGGGGDRAGLAVGGEGVAAVAIEIAGELIQQDHQGQGAFGPRRPRRRTCPARRPGGPVRTSGGWRRRTRRTWRTTWSARRRSRSPARPAVWRSWRISWGGVRRRRRSNAVHGARATLNYKG